MNTIVPSALCAFLLLTPALAGAQSRVQLPAKDEVLTLSSQPVFTVGAAEGREWETFANVFDVTFDRHGNLYVLDAGNRRVHVFDRTGAHLRSFGRQGGGPGEFLAPVGLAVTSEGQLAVNDMGRQGLQLLTLEGKPVRTVAGDAGTMMIGRVRAHPRGGVIGMTQAAPATGDLPTSTPPRSVSWLASDAPVRVLYNAPAQAVTHGEDGPKEPGQLVVVGTPVFTPQLHWAVLPNGIAAAHTVHYRVTIADESGRPLRILERDIQPRKVTKRDRDRFIAEQADAPAVFVGAGGSARPPMPPVTSFADIMPVISGIAADPEGRIWIRRTAGDDRVIDIIDAGGRYLGTVRGASLPAAFGPEGMVAYIENDELGITRVAVRNVSLSSGARRGR
jgi:hypothetical protein